LSNIWQKKGLLAYLLLPISLLFKSVALLRVRLYAAGILKVNNFGLPVIVVGNISVGGTGKTPIVAAVVKRCQSMGMKPGIVSRGYGAVPAKLPRLIDSTTPVEFSGDEPLLLVRNTRVPTCICGNRSAAVSWLSQNSDIDVVVSDDGMQHYAMHRDFEIAVVDGQRQLGNGWLLPAGPLREPPKRLRAVDIIAIQHSKSATVTQQQHVLANLKSAVMGMALPRKSKTKPVTTAFASAGHFHLDIISVKNLANQQTIALQTLQGQRVHAVAGVGNPDRYFRSLQDAEIEVIEHPMPDHHRYSPEDLTFNDQLPILVTSKDAVKIEVLAMDLTRVYEVSVIAIFDADLEQAIDNMIKTLC